MSKGSYNSLEIEFIGAKSDVIKEIFGVKVRFELELICRVSYVSKRQDWKVDWSQIPKVLKAKLFSFDSILTLYWTIAVMKVSEQKLNIIRAISKESQFSSCERDRKLKRIKDQLRDG